MLFQVYILKILFQYRGHFEGGPLHNHLNLKLQTSSMLIGIYAGVI